MLPRALIGPVMAVARGPARPPLEGRLVREAVASAPSHAPREPLARDLARRVVEELAAFLAEPDDPLLSAIGEMNRKVFPSPVTALASDGEVDTLSLFIEGRVDALRNRHGRGLSPTDDAAERRAVMADIERRLARRYLRHLRAE